MDIGVSLIRRCKQRDEDALNQLFSRYEGYLYKICYSFTHNQEDALDVMQEVYVKIFRSIDSFNEELPLLPWMKNIVI